MKFAVRWCVVVLVAALGLVVACKDRSPDQKPPVCPPAGSGGPGALPFWCSSVDKRCNCGNVDDCINMVLADVCGKDWDCEPTNPDVCHCGS